MEKLKSIVLAAGKGTRMRTDGQDAPKVMRSALGRPLLAYVLDALPVASRADAVVVVGYMKEQVIAAFPECTFAVQAEQLGTGHAVICAADALAGYNGDVLICCGDTPLVRRETYDALVSRHREAGNDCTLLSGTSPTPLAGYGRVLRSADGGFVRIVEERDCTPEEAAVREYNSGIYIFNAKKLFSALSELKSDNAQSEYYLTDAPAIMLRRGDKVGVCVREMGSELIGVNTPEQLKEVENVLLTRKS